MNITEKINNYLNEAKQLSLLNKNLSGPFKDKSGNEYYGEPKKVKNLKHVAVGTGDMFYNDKGFISVSYRGNMGANLKDVKEMVDKTFGPGAFNDFYGKKTFETGSPDYQYEFQAQVDPNKWFNKNKKIPV